jgi:hypothetical protein
VAYRRWRTRSTTGSSREGIAVASAQVVRGGEATEDVSGGVDDLVRQAERRPGLDDEHGAQLPGPLVDVLEDRPVEGAQVVEVVLARQAPTLELVHAHRRELLFRDRQLRPVREAQAVAEDSATGIEVGVAAHFRY